MIICCNVVEMQRKVLVPQIMWLIVSIFCGIVSLFIDYLLRVYPYNFKTGKDPDNNENRQFYWSMERKVAWPKIRETYPPLGNSQCSVVHETQRTQW